MEVRLLGGLEIVADDGATVAVAGAKLRSLLALLALSCGRVVGVDRLQDALWGDDRPSDAANALQRLVSKLRRTLADGEVIATSAAGYSLQIDRDRVDVFRFERIGESARAALAAGELDQALERFAEADALWRGAPLADFAYEDFAQAHIARLEELRLSLVEDRMDAELAVGRDAQLVADLEELVDANPLRERFRGQLMLALYRAGRQADALRVFQDGRAVLAEELGLDPGPELRRLEAAILAQDPALNPAKATQTKEPPPARVSRTNLKAPLTPLVGRAEELTELAKLVEVQRLVTVVGPGGAGKTRLAEETARVVTEWVDDGAFVVELASLVDGTTIPDAIASAIDLADSDTDALLRVCQHCRDRELLLVLDNCEHVIGAAARVAEELVRRCERIHIVATSREPLRITGETVWPVPPLPDTDAVELFVQRAVAVNPAFRADPSSLSLIREICSRLDGLPLAIELAAARTRAFPLDNIAERLSDRFRLLTGGSRTAMARQQTLKAVVDWSYDLLFEDERRVFERLSIFPAGCSFDAARAACAADDIDEADIEDMIVSLLDKSLVFLDTSTIEPRYRMLQTLSDYGRQRLVERGDADAAYERMARHMAEMCTQSRSALRGVNQHQWFERINAEFENVRAAFDWAVATERSELALAIAADLAVHRWVVGKVDEVHRWLTTALALPAQASPLTRGRGLLWRAYLGYLAGKGDLMEADFETAIALLREHADQGEVGVALAFYAQIVAETGQTERAAELNRQSLALVSADSDDPWLRAARTWLQATLAEQADRDHDNHESLLREAVSQFEEAGDAFMTGIALNMVAEFDERRGNYSEATAALTRAFELAARMHLSGFEASLRARLGNVALQSNDLETAESHIEEALRQGDELVYTPVRAESLIGLANLRRRQDRIDEAAAAASEALELYGGAASRSFAASISGSAARYDVPSGAAAAFSVLGFVAELRGEPDQARAHHRASLDQARLVLDPRSTALAIEGMAGAEALGGDGTLAAQLLGLAERFRSSERARRAPSEVADVERARHAAVALLGDAAFGVAFEQGRQAELQELVSGSGGG